MQNRRPHRVRARHKGRPYLGLAVDHDRLCPSAARDKSIRTIRSPSPEDASPHAAAPRASSGRLPRPLLQAWRPCPPPATSGANAASTCARGLRSSTTVRQSLCPGLSGAARATGPKARPPDDDDIGFQSDPSPVSCRKTRTGERRQGQRALVLQRVGNRQRPAPSHLPRGAAPRRRNGPVAARAARAEGRSR